jgi:hypothetical protein
MFWTKASGSFIQSRPEALLGERNGLTSTHPPQIPVGNGGGAVSQEITDGRQSCPLPLKIKRIAMAEAMGMHSLDNTCPTGKPP